MKKIEKLMITTFFALAFLLILITNVNATEITDKNEFKEALITGKTNITLESDIEITNDDLNTDYCFNIYSNTVLDLNGHTISVNKDLNDEYGMVVLFNNNDCTLMITDSAGEGKIVGKNTKNQLFQFINTDDSEKSYTGCRVIIEGGIFEGPNSTMPIMTAKTSKQIDFTVNDGTFIINSNFGSVFDDKFNLELSNMVVKSSFNTGRFYITDDTTEMVNVIDNNSDKYMDKWYKKIYR